MTGYHLSINIRSTRGDRRSVSFQTELKAARKIEEYLNQQIDSYPLGETREFDYYEIANALLLTKKIVSKILRANGGGSNGITIGKPKNLKPD